MSESKRITTTITAFAATVGLGLGVAIPPHAAAANEGWIEAVAIVRTLDRHVRFFEETGGYQVIHRGPVDRAILRRWSLPDSVQGQEVVLAEPGTHRGLLRLVALDGVGAAREVRPAGQFQDTGGIMGLNVRVSDIARTFERLQSAGWRPYSEPVWFSVAAFSVGEAVFAGPDGLVLGLIERERPPLGPEWSIAAGEFSRPNNAFVVSADIDRAQRFYEHSMGWKSFLEDSGPAAPAGRNLYGWPHDVVEQVARRVVWLHPSDGGEGSIALMAFDGAAGTDFSAAARPPNFGWVALRSWGDGDGGGEPAWLPPHGCVSIRVLVDTDGVRHELLRPADGCGAALTLPARATD